jgi:hypothetical protein
LSSTVEDVVALELVERDVVAEVADLVGDDVVASSEPRPRRSSADEADEAVASSEPRPRRSSTEAEVEEEGDVGAVVAVAESSAPWPPRPRSSTVLEAVGVDELESSLIVGTEAGALGRKVELAAATPNSAGTMATPAAMLMRTVRFMMTPWKWCVAVTTSSPSSQDLATMRQRH